MIIGKNAVVSLVYRLFGEDGKLIERTREPVSYLHGGYGGIFPDVEARLEGCKRGDRIELVLEPAAAFGEYDAALVRSEPREQFPDEVRVGMRFEGPAGAGEHRPVVYTVTSVSAERVLLDGNHELAGRRLRFACTVAGVRAASAEELAHGHAHGPGGHHHHG